MQVRKNIQSVFVRIFVAVLIIIPLAFAAACTVQAASMAPTDVGQVMAFNSPVTAETTNNPFLPQFVQNFLLAVAPIIGSELVAWLIVKIRKAWQEFQANKPDAAWTLKWVAKEAVQAAEMAGINKVVTDKKKYAIDCVEKYLRSKGFDIDLDQIDVAIESAVFENINKDKLTKTLPSAEVTQ